MSKQDRQGVRSASDLEQKYSFGKTFAEITSDTKKAMEAAKNAAASFEGLDQDAIFNILTNNGTAKGVYREGEEIYINASYIGTGQIVSRNFSDDYSTLVRYSYKELEATTYYFRLDEGSTDYYYFTTTAAVPFGGSIRFYESEMNIKTIDASGNEIETKSATKIHMPVVTNLDLDVSVYFSENGMKIDLENGNIFSKEFSIVDGKAYFGGDLEVDFGRIGAFSLSRRGLASISSKGCGVTLTDSWLYFASDVFGNNTGGNVKFSAGDMDESDPHVIEVSNSNGDSLKVTPSSANITGAWKATPYTDSEAQNSEIVTKQDLINLGLIS